MQKHSRLVTDYIETKKNLKGKVLELITYIESVDDEDKELQEDTIKTARQALNKIDKHFNKLIARSTPKVIKSFTEN